MLLSLLGLGTQAYIGGGCGVGAVSDGRNHSVVGELDRLRPAPYYCLVTALVPPSLRQYSITLTVTPESFTSLVRAIHVRPTLTPLHRESMDCGRYYYRMALWFWDASLYWWWLWAWLPYQMGDFEAMIVFSLS